MCFKLVGAFLLIMGQLFSTIVLGQVTVEPIATLQGRTEWVFSVAFSPDGKTLAGGIADGSIKLWDIETIATSQYTLGGHSRWVTSIAFSPDGRMLASGSYDKTIRLWDVATRQHIATLEGHTQFVTSVAFSPDGVGLFRGVFS